MRTNNINFEIGMERDVIPIYFEGRHSSIGYEDTIVDYYITVYGIKVFIPKERYEDIIKNMYKNE